MTSWDCNGTHFNPYDFYGYSVENEIGISPHCLPNLLKLCTFSIYLIIFGIFFMLSIVGIFREYFFVLKWNTNLRRFTALIIFCAAHICLFSIWITGTFNRGKYALFPLTFTLFCQLGIASSKEWYEAYRMMQTLGQKQDGAMQWIQMRSNILTVFLWSGFILWWMVLPMIFFDNPWVLNWMIAIGYTHLCSMTIFVGAFNIRMAKRLLDNIKSAVEHEMTDKKIARFLKKLQRVRNTTIYSCVIISVLFLTLIWVGVTQTSTNPGLQNFFYFEFFVSVPLRLLMGISTFTVAWTRSDSLSANTSSVANELKGVSEDSKSPNGN